MSQSPSLSLGVRVAMDTDTGRKRQQNQDAIGHLIPTDQSTLETLGQIFVLADGVGGLSGGDLASQYAVSTIISSYYEQEEGEPPERLARAIAEANSLIHAEGQTTPGIMATTVVTAVIRGRDLVIGSVGDSPAFLMRDAEVRQLTQDHTLESAQRDAGHPLDEGDPAGRKLVRALGSAPSVKVDIITGPVRGGDYVVLCSDGLTRYVDPAEIESIVATLSPERAVKALIEMANERGGADNISVIVLHLHDDDETSGDLMAVRDPMEGWGRPRSREVDRTQLHQPTVPSASPPARDRVRSRVRKSPTETDTPADNPLLDLWHLLRGNAVITGIGMAVLLVVFVVIMLVVFNAGDDESAANRTPQPTSPPASDLTATAALHGAATAQAAAIQTNEAQQAAEATRVILMTLTPPTPYPTSGPQMTEGVWFRVLEGQPIPAYTEPDIEAEPATDLEVDENYRVTLVNNEANYGPWYQVIDNRGFEARWVSGPSLHKRIVVIDTSGNPLPPEQQPLDVAPPGAPRTSATAPATPTATVESAVETPVTTGTPFDIPHTPATLTPMSQPTIVYGVESWSQGDFVKLKTDLELRETPDVDASVTGEAALNEIGTVVAGPVAAGEHWWWEIEFPDGRKGWIAQVLLATP
jgi:serine/threonine protein phosphatase PrpC